MNPTLKAAQDGLQALITEAEELQAKSSHTDEESARYGELPAAIDAAREKVSDAKKASKAIDEAKTFLNGSGQKIESVVADMELKRDGDAEERFLKSRNLRGQVRNLSGNSIEEKRIKAYRFGMFLMAACGNEHARKFCNAQGIPLAVDNVEGIPEAGGALVPDEFENELLILREQYGIFRTFARYSPMSGDTKIRPRQKGGLTAYAVGEAKAITKSRIDVDRIRLVAKKIGVIAVVSSELNEDAIIEMGDHTIGEIGYAFAKFEDGCGFIGDGSSTYHTITGVTTKLKNEFDTDGGEGLIVGTGNAYSELTIGDFQKVVGALPEFADDGDAAWYCSRKFFWETMIRVALASGGTTAAEVVAGLERRFMGYPVRVSQIMPKTEANSQVPVVFGSMRQAADFGDRRRTTITMSPHATVNGESVFEQDELAIRGTERIDINVHDIGTSGTEAGPLVGLIMAAS